MKQAAGTGHREEATYLRATSRFSEYGHVRSVSSKVGDIVSDPFQRRNQIELAYVAKAANFGSKLPREVYPKAFNR